MKRLTLIPIGGLGNRIFAIASTIAYCKKQKCPLRIVWFRDWGMGARFRELFELSDKVKNVEVIDARWQDYIYDRPRRRNLWLPYLYQRFAFDERLYERKIYREGTDTILPYLQAARNPYLLPRKHLPGLFRHSSLQKNRIEFRLIHLDLNIAAALFFKLLRCDLL